MVLKQIESSLEKNWFTKSQFIQKNRLRMGKKSDTMPNTHSHILMDV